MREIARLAWRNLTRKPGRTALLLILTALLSLSIFGGSAMVLGMRGGLKQVEGRLGADIIVVPASARSRTDLSNLLLNGTTGYFYMSHDVLSEIEAQEGVERASAQIFMASLRAACCSMALQVIGIDQDTDFVVQPWIARRYHGVLGDLEVVAGSRINAGVGDVIRIYNESCTVVAKLESTGTGFDTALFAGMGTIRMLLKAAERMGHPLKISGDPAETISAVYVEVKDGYSVEAAAGKINVYVHKVQAVQTRKMFSGVSDSLSGMARATVWLTAALWLLSFLILLAAFCLLMNSRKREFAVLRVLGASRRMLSRLSLIEILLLSAAGCAAGILAGAAVLLSFHTLIETSVGLPMILPEGRSLLLLSAVTLLAGLLTALLASAWSACRLSAVDAGTILREGT